MATNSKPPLSGSGSQAYWVRLGRCLSTDCYSAHFGGCCTRRAHSSLHGTATAPCRAATAHRPAARHCNTATLHYAATRHTATAATLCCTLHRTYTATKRSHHTYINLRCNVVTYIYAGLICSAIFGLRIAMSDMIARLVHMLRNWPNLPHFAHKTVWQCNTHLSKFCEETIMLHFFWDTLYISQGNTNHII